MDCDTNLNFTTLKCVAWFWDHMRSLCGKRRRRRRSEESKDILVDRDGRSPGLVAGF